MTILRSRCLSALASFAIIFSSSTFLFGQFTIKIPKIPKISKEKPQSTSDSGSTNTGGAYDEETFQSIISDTGYDDWGGYSSFITPYLNCYGMKHNISENTVEAWPQIHGADNERALALGQQRLADLESKLKSRMRSFPDTGREPRNNPAIYYEIATKRAEYLQCRRDANKPAVRDCASDSVMSYHLEEVEKTRKEAEEFTPGLREYYVSTLSDRKNMYMEAALLPKTRGEFFGKWPPEFVNCMTPALDGLAAAARKTLPSYTGPAGYTFGTPAEKKVLSSTISDVSQAKVLKSGLKQASWLIDKNDYGLPTARYKHGYVWLQYPGQEFCWVYLINLVQDYAGGGTYGASYGSYISRSFAGCTGK